MASNQELKILGLISRWVLTALACWWLFWFIVLIGSSSDIAQESAGMALGKAAICGAVAAAWFYRAREQQAAESLSPPVHANTTPQDATPKARPIPLQQTNKLPQREPSPPATEPSAVPEIQQARGTSDSVQGTPSDWKQIAFISIALAVFIVIFIAINQQNGTADVPSGPNSSNAIGTTPKAPDLSELLEEKYGAGTTPKAFDLSEFLEEKYGAGTTPKSLDQFSKSLFEKGTESPPCPAGLNAGAQVASIKDPTILVGSNGAIQGKWQLSFVLSNKSDVSDPKFGGYCITAFEVEAELEDANGRVWKVVGEQRLGSSYSYLSPGWSQKFANLDLRPLAKPDGTPTPDAELTIWKVTKAWGFPLSLLDAPKQ